MAWPRMTTHATIHHFRARRNPSREIGCHRLRSRRGNGIVERVPCRTRWPCHLPLQPPPEGARHSCLELDIHALDPSLRSSKVWPVTLGWHQMVKGSWLSPPSTRNTEQMRSLRSACRLPIASTPSRHDTHPRCVLERPFLDSRCPILGFRAHAAKRHGRFISCTSSCCHHTHRCPHTSTVAQAFCRHLRA